MKKQMQMRTELERDGGFMMVDVIGDVNYFIDSKYGADADGNRWQSIKTADEVTDIYVWDLEGNKIGVTAEEEDYLANRLKIKLLEE